MVTGFIPGVMAPRRKRSTRSGSERRRRESQDRSHQERRRLASKGRPREEEAKRQRPPRTSSHMLAKVASAVAEKFGPKLPAAAEVEKCGQDRRQSMQKGKSKGTGKGGKGATKGEGTTRGCGEPPAVAGTSAVPTRGCGERSD